MDTKGIMMMALRDRRGKCRIRENIRETGNVIENSIILRYIVTKFSGFGCDYKYQIQACRPPM